MRILFDQGTATPLRGYLAPHEVSTAHELGWSSLRNGDLLATAEAQFDVLVTTDQHLKHEQKLEGRRLAIVVLMTTSWPRIRRETHRVLEALGAARPGVVTEVDFPDRHHP